MSIQGFPRFSVLVDMVDRNEAVDILSALEGQKLVMTQLAARSEREVKVRYAVDKWSVKEVVGHLADTERIFASGCVARGDQTQRRGVANDNEVTVLAWPTSWRNTDFATDGVWKRSTCQQFSRA
jgi:hypothetical protein